MDILKKKTETDFNFNEKEIKSFEMLYREDSRSFVFKLSEKLNTFENEKQWPRLLEFYQRLYSEITDTAPFASKAWNRIFQLLLRKKIVKAIVDFNHLIFESADPFLIDQLKKLINSSDIKILDRVEIYRLKKLIYDLEKKYENKDDLLFKINMDVHEPDLSWKNHIDF